MDGEPCRIDTYEGIAVLIGKPRRMCFQAVDDAFMREVQSWICQAQARVEEAERKTMWQPALKRAGVRYRKPYTTRHTYASMMLMAGEPVQWVAQQMGHTDWAFTARTYAKWIPDDAPEAGEKAERTYGKQSEVKRA